ncbi:MAG: AmmeMemoRadiSam system protein A [Sulfurihydrogenibium sp.]|uniref:AmmeMemoRadiSam system protein A n=1 Tax=Sulfurihydrogenibium azorense TaxID=309806 RepID=A0A832D9M8_9AQUI|nr:MAG: AmmeMemoRadiSam system protein A [Sulfurihydrogenibium sp.]HEV08988.1 AmmeMemoRadiSam system protein A [Sulfurihydrogenibium azorense]
MSLDTQVISSISKEEGQFLLNLARKSIEHYLKSRQILFLDESQIPYENLKKKGASFVTLETKNGTLRGCIGSIIPHRPLYEDVIHNAVSAAVSDPRFYPLTIEELPFIKIKVSVLTYPQPLHYTDWQDLLNKLKPFEDGVIIKYKNHSATFLPDVWEDLPNKEEFLSHLCLKAGLPANFWKTGLLEVYTYKTISFQEE